MKGLLLALGVQLAAGLPASPANTQTEHLSHAKDEAFPTLTLANITKAGMSDIKGRSLTGPFLGADFPDPSIIWGDGSWKTYGTSSNGKRVPVATSSDTLSWTLTNNDALPNPGTWVDQNDKSIWAPDIQKNVSLQRLRGVFHVKDVDMISRMRGHTSVSISQRYHFIPASFCSLFSK